MKLTHLFILIQKYFDDLIPEKGDFDTMDMELIDETKQLYEDR